MNKHEKKLFKKLVKATQQGEIPEKLMAQADKACGFKIKKGKIK